MTIGSYSSTRNVTSLAPGTSLTLTFDTWSHPIAANETLTVCSQLSGDQNPENNCISKAIKVLNLAKTVYGYIVNPGSSGDPVGPVRFSLSNPGNITSLANQGTLAPLYAGTWADGKWYACSGGITGPWSLLTIDPNTGNRTMIGNLGIAINGLSFNTLDSSLYGITGSSLYRINKSNGVTTLMGTFAGVSLSGLAINLSGQAYSIDHVNDVLGTINLITGAFTPVGSLGFSANLDQDIEFDRESGNLYQCSFGAQGTLRYVDQSTGNTMLVGDFDGGALINGFAIPYFITLPIVSAPTATSVTQTALVTGSAIVSTGGANITQKGFCWSVTPNPTLADQHIVAGSGTTSFTSSITGLMPCMTYHVRAFATNSAGISYSEDISFCTICISTDTATNITINGATSGGTITCNGSEDVTARGVCWSVDSLPTVAGSHTTNGAGNGHFSSSLTGLTPGNYYYYRAYLINNDGIFYGNQIRFRVYKLPSIATTPITNTTTTTATSGGSVTVDGYPAITVKGVCYSTLTNPTIADPHTSDGSGSASYISSLNGLLPETGYYVRAYAINAAGTVYGNPQSMKTLPTACLPSVTYGGKTYPTLMIGEKCWLKENLNIGSMISGNITQANNAVIEKYCINNVASNCDIYGGLYQWGEVVQYLNGASNSINWNPSPTGYVQGICPTNWHLPSDAEWTALSTSLGGANVAGGKMKESGTAHWISPNTSASNSSGFTGLPGGFRDSDGSMYDLGYYGYYWSATPNDNLNSWSNILSFNNAKLERYNGIKTNGFAVRCIKNNLPPPATLTITSDTLFSSNSLCYNALQTITVAGNGNKFLVQNGGSATFIAGENIRFLTGTKVLSGGYLRGYIETSGSFCSNQSISKELNVVIESNIEFALFQSYERLLIYPNPTSNNCVLQLPEILSTKEFTIKIFSIYGKQLYSKYYLSEAITEDKIYLSINKLPAGFYLVKLISNSTLLEGNIIKY
jgi:uncharacterized protein (TIGR02145 family)